MFTGSSFFLALHQSRKELCNFFLVVNACIWHQQLPSDSLQGSMETSFHALEGRIIALGHILVLDAAVLRKGFIILGWWWQATNQNNTGQRCFCDKLSGLRTTSVTYLNIVIVMNVLYCSADEILHRRSTEKTFYFPSCSTWFMVLLKLFFFFIPCVKMHHFVFSTFIKFQMSM